MKKLTVLQLFMIMYVSRIFVTLMYTPSIGHNMNVSDLMLQVIFGWAFVLVTVIPIFLLVKDDNTNGLIDRCKNVSPTFGKLSAIVFFLAFFYFSVRILVRFDVFASTVVFPGSDVRIFLFLIILCALYCVLMGLDSLGRTTGIFFAFIILSIIIVLVFTTDRIHLTNFTPFLYEGVGMPLKAGIFTMAATVEILYPVLLKDKLPKNPIVCIYPWICIIMASIFIIMFWQAGALGDYANTQLFPFFSLTALSEIGFLERLDAFLTASWMVSVFVKLSITIYFCAKFLRTVFNNMNYKTSVLIVSGLMAVLAIFIKDGYLARQILTETGILVVIYAVATIVIPVALLITEKNRKRGQKDA